MNNTMSLDEAKQLLAKQIYRIGEVKNGYGCLVPSCYANVDLGNEDYSNMSDALNETYGATHFDLSWTNDRKSIKVVLYCSDGFGAVLDCGPVVYEYVLEV